MVVLAGAQILLRNLFGSGIDWADPLLRALVLWTAMLGALAAARDDKHIGLDLVTHFVHGRAKRVLRAIALTFAAAISAAMAWYGLNLVHARLMDPASVAFAGVPSWCVESILPVGFRAARRCVSLMHAFLPAEERRAGARARIPMIILAGLALVLLAVLGAPLFALIAAIALLGFHAAGQEGVAVAVEFYRLADMPALIAIPLFTLAGYLLAESRAPQRLVRVSNALLGWLPGGLAIVAVIACAMFTAFTGATGVTIVALGAVLYPALVQARYGERFSLGLLTASGSLGLILVPSMPLILYGVVAQQFHTTPPVSIDALFKAGVLPCVLMVVLLGDLQHLARAAHGRRARAHERA